MGRKKIRVGTLDAETDPFLYGRVPKPFVWGLYLDSEFHVFWGDDCTEQLMEFLSDEKDLLLYAHNGGKFDFHFFINHLDPSINIINGRIAKCTLNGGAIELRDSFLILPLPLSAHEKDSFDYRKMEVVSRESHKAEIINYLRTDCISLYDWVSDFRKNFGNGLTLAGSTFKQLKQTGYEIDNTPEHFDSKFRPFYLGGRVQCFEVGEFKGNLKYVDINSAYPFAMMSKHWHGSQYCEHFKLPDNDNGSWYAEITAKSYGALPFKSPDNGKLYFPDDGKPRKFFATGWEINAGLETGTLDVLKCHRSYRPVFTESFEAYVEKFYAMKLGAEQRGDKTMRLFAKLMLNSCYGKFGQDGRKYEKFCVTEAGDFPDGEGWTLHTMRDGYWIHSRPDPVDRFFNVCTAASVTGFVRAYLWKAICDCERPLYCDTDSIICYDFNGEISDKLGAWDLEAEPVEAYIAQRKMYALRMADGNEKVASKGVRLSFDQIKHGVLSGESLDTRRDAPAFSLKYGARFIDRVVTFKNIEKNACANPL